MDALKLLWLLVKLQLLRVALVQLPGANSLDLDSRSGLRNCAFPAVFNFGDSNSDTGGVSASLSEVTAPNGETFFGHPSGRFCDGRLIIDFIAETLKLPYLSPYLDSLGTNFRHGVNFAAAGSSIRPGGYSPFHLGIQIAQFLQLKARAKALYGQSRHENQALLNRLPRPQDFSQALYTFDIGQNDLAYGFQHTNAKRVRASIPDILMQLSQAVHQLYREGARFFWIHNTGPIGCLPYSIIYDRSKPANLDKSGCVDPENKIAREFNKQLEITVLNLRSQLHEAVLTYVDIYSVKYELIRKAMPLGFVDPANFCCGSFYGYHINCGKKKVVNGTLYGNPCSDPSRHVSWDGIHYSEAANKWIAERLINGLVSDPPVGIVDACRARN